MRDPDNEYRLPTPEDLIAERLRIDPSPDAPSMPAGQYLDVFLVTCSGNAAVVLERARQIMRLINAAQEGDLWPAADIEWNAVGLELLTKWRNVLPDWFVEGFHPERSREERLVYWETRDKMDRAAELHDLRYAPWELSDWLFWMCPHERYWIWYDAMVKSPDCVRIRIDQLGDEPTPGEPPGFRWLWLPCGGTDFEEAPLGEDRNFDLSGE